MESRVRDAHRRLVAALDNVQESYHLLKSDVFPDAEVCHDLPEQLAIAYEAAEQ
jgi:hypothetical protein